MQLIHIYYESAGIQSLRIFLNQPVPGMTWSQKAWQNKRGPFKSPFDSLSSHILCWNSWFLKAHSTNSEIVVLLMAIIGTHRVFYCSGASCQQELVIFHITQKRKVSIISTIILWNTQECCESWCHSSHRQRQKSNLFLAPLSVQIS